MGTTTKWGLPYSDGSDQLSSVDDSMQDLAEAVDPKLTPLTQGPLSNILAGGSMESSVAHPGKLGRHYLATDNGVVYLDSGIGWIALTEEIGAVSWWAGAGDPPGGTHLEADGRPIARASYPLYASIIGTTHGGNVTQVNLPDVAERFIVGRDRGKNRIPNSPRTIGASGGEERHALTVGELAAHKHDHTGETGQTHPNEAGADGDRFQIGWGGAGRQVTGTRSENAGSGTAHQNMPPYIALTPIVRVR